MARWLAWSPGEGRVDATDSEDAAQQICDDLIADGEYASGDDIYPVQECPEHEGLPREGCAECDEETPQIQAGDRVVAVEHDDATRQRRPGGRRLTATVVEAEGIYVQVRYDDTGVSGTRPDVYFADSLWRAYDGQFRWRLEPISEED